MAKKFIHGFNGHFAQTPSGGHFVAMTSPAPYSQFDIITSSVSGCTASVISTTATQKQIDFTSTATVDNPWSMSASFELFNLAVSGYSHVRVYATPSLFPSSPLDYTDSFTATMKVNGSVVATNSASYSAALGDFGIYNHTFDVPYYRHRTTLSFAYGDTVGYGYGTGNAVMHVTVTLLA